MTRGLEWTACVLVFYMDFGIQPCISTEISRAFNPKPKPKTLNSKPKP